MRIKDIEGLLFPSATLLLDTNLIYRIDFRFYKVHHENTTFRITDETRKMYGKTILLVPLPLH